MMSLQYHYYRLPRKAATDKWAMHSGMGVAHHSCRITFLYVCTELIHSCFQVNIPILVCFNTATWSTCWSNSDSVKGKGTAILLEAYSGTEGSRKLRFPDFMTSAQDGGKVVSPTHRLPLPPGNTPGTHFC
jgi:hypothetical protein